MAEPLIKSPYLQEVRDLNADKLGELTDPQTAEVLWQLNVEQKGLAEKYDKDLFFKGLGTYRNDIDFWDSLGRGASRGWYAVSDALDLADQTIRDATGGVLDPIMYTDEEYAARRVARDKGRDKNPYSYEDLNKLAAITAEDSSFSDWTSNIFDISLVGGLLSESLVQFAPALGAAALVGFTGGAAAPVLAPLATFLIQSGVVGSSAFHEYLKEEEGVKTEEDYLKAFKDPDVMRRATIYGAKYGVPVAALDAFSLGIAGKLPQIGMAARRAAGKATRTDSISKIGASVDDALSAKRKAAKFAQRWTPEVIVQGALGAGGELAGSYLAKGKVNYGEAFLEAILEPMTLPLELMVKSPKITKEYLKEKNRRDPSNRTKKRFLLEQGLPREDVQNKTKEQIDDLFIIHSKSKRNRERVRNRREAQETVYPTDTNADSRAFIFDNIEATDAEVTTAQQTVGENPSEVAMDPSKRTLTAASLGEEAKTFEALGYIEEIKDQPGYYLVTRKGIDSIKPPAPVVPKTKGKGKQGTQGEAAPESDVKKDTPLTDDQIIAADQDEYVAQVNGILEETLASLEANEEITDTSLLERIADLVGASELLLDAQVLPAQKKALETMRRVLTHTKPRKGRPSVLRKRELKGAELEATRIIDGALLRLTYGRDGAIYTATETTERVADPEKQPNGAPKNKATTNKATTKKATTNKTASKKKKKEVVDTDAPVVLEEGNEYIPPQGSGVVRVTSSGGGQPTVRTIKLIEEMEDIPRSQFDNEADFEKYKANRDNIAAMRENGKKILAILREAQVQVAPEVVAETTQAKEFVDTGVRTDDQRIDAVDQMVKQDTLGDEFNAVERDPSKLARAAIEREKEDGIDITQLDKDNISGIEEFEAILGEDAAREIGEEEERKGVDPDIELERVAKAVIQRAEELKTTDYNVASNTADEIEAANAAAGDNTLGTLPPENQLQLIEWIQSIVGPNIRVSFQTIKEMTERVRVLKNMPPNMTVQGYANPLDKIIVLALDAQYSLQVAGEEAFHMVARLLLSEEELIILNDYNWVAIAADNGIDVSQYPDDLKEWEALAKVAAKFLTGEKVINIGPNNKKIMQRLKNFLAQLANWVRGRGWKKLYPSPRDTFISIGAGELASRPHNPYPIGPVSKDFDLNAVSDLEKITKRSMAHEAPPGGTDRGSVTFIAQGWAYLQEAFNHPGFYAAKNYLFRPVFAILEEMRQYQDTLLMEGLESFRDYSKATRKTQNEADQFITLMDFLTTRNNWKPNFEVGADGSQTFEMPTAEQVGGEEIQQKLDQLYPKGINGKPVKLTEETLNEEGDVTSRIPRSYTLSGQQDKSEVSPARAFESFQEGSEYQRGLLIKAITQLIAEMPKDSTQADLDARVRFLTNEIAGSYVGLDKQGNPVVTPETKMMIKERDSVVVALKYIKELNDNPYWIPRVRKGERAIFVRDKGTDVVRGKVQHLEVYDIKKFESAKAFTKMLSERQEEIQKNFPDHDVKVDEWNLSENVSDALSSKTGNFTVVSGISVVEALMTEMNDPETDTSKIDKIIKLIKKEAEGQKLRGVGENRQAQNITGHWRPDLQGYVNMATKSNLHTMTYQLAKISYAPLIEDEKKLMQEQHAAAVGDPVRAAAIARTQRYTEKYLNFVNNPKTQGALIRNFVFHTALGGRFSSAILNLMQLPQVLLPFMYAVNPDQFLLDSPFAVAKNTFIIGKAFRDANRLAIRSGFGKNQTAYNMRLDGERPSYLDEGEWEFLRVLFGRGILSPVNLDDLTDNLSYQAYVRAGGKASTFFAAVDRGAELSSWMFGSTEFINRATTALAMYRTARDNEAVLARMNKVRQQSHFKDSTVPSMDLNNDQLGWTNAAHIAVAETQFMMGKFNRPQLFYSMPGMPVVTQFMSFPFQYLETMVKNIRRMATPGERAIGTRMLSLMLVAMIGMAGVLGIPFMENLRRLINVISDTDIERDMREVLLPLVGKTATNVIVSGGIFEFLGVEAKTRIGVGTMVDSGIFRGDLGFVFGPLGGVIETGVNSIVEGIDEDNISKIAFGLIPLGFARDVINMGNTFEEGYRTRSGTTLIAPQDILPGDYFISFLGFNPANKALARDKQAYASSLRTRGQNKRNIVLKRMTRLQRKGRESSTREQREDYMDEFRHELRQWNSKAREKGWPLISNQLLMNRFLANINPEAAILKRAPKVVKPELQRLVQMLNRLSPSA